MSMNKGNWGKTGVCVILCLCVYEVLHTYKLEKKPSTKFVKATNN